MKGGACMPDKTENAEKIGDFSKRCEVTIKTLRYYDKLGLLVPDYVDKFTGYRYYGAEKVAEMRRITELKDIGFSLEEINRFFSAESDGEKHQIIWQKRQELEKLASDTARQLGNLTEIEEKINLYFTDKKGEQNMSTPVKFNAEFENDEKVIGRWEVIDMVDKKESFIPGSDSYRKSVSSGEFFKEIYFLPDGGEYWVFSWTKGYVKMSSGDGKLMCRYETEEIGGSVYMFLEYHEDTVVLTQTDKKRYTRKEIGQYDNIDMPFVNDEKILGKWAVVDFVRYIEDFDPSQQKYSDRLFYKSVEFLPDGELNCTIGNIFKARWTKGTTLIKSGSGDIAEAYELRTFNGTDYLFIEWKSGDYTYGKMKPCYYVFVRE
jgi:DNA-binding transcriptional MerR regulator